MTGVNVVIGVLVILGAIMVMLGLFGGPQLQVMGMGLVAIIAAGILGIVASRR